MLAAAGKEAGLCDITDRGLENSLSFLQISTQANLGLLISPQKRISGHVSVTQSYQVNLKNHNRF